LTVVAQHNIFHTSYLKGKKDRQTGWKADIKADSKTNRQTRDRQTDKGQTYRKETDRQTRDRQTEKRQRDRLVESRKD
jgi:hypothetical protein